MLLGILFAIVGVVAVITIFSHNKGLKRVVNKFLEKHPDRKNKEDDRNKIL